MVKITRGLKSGRRTPPKNAIFVQDPKLLKSGRIKHGWTTQIEVKGNIFAEFNAMVLCTLIRNNLLKLYKEQLLAGNEGGTGKKLKRVSQHTLKRAEKHGRKRLSDAWFNRTGKSIHNMTADPVRGSSVRASAVIHPPIPQKRSGGNLLHLVDEADAEGIALIGGGPLTDKVVELVLEAYLEGALGPYITNAQDLDYGTIKASEV